ncbi:MAG: disulfide bond formation protein B [Pseudomonadota bacterium]|nr:disulfide bond formation protein B [Pseudomonadota bacterium]
MSFEFGPFYFGKIPAARLVPALALGVSLTALAAAYGSQYWGGLTPCVLCLYQRAAYGAVTLFAAGALGFALKDREKSARFLTGLCALGFLTGAGIAFYHVGVEQHWWTGSEACVGAATRNAQTIEELRAQLMAAPLTRCDDVAWSLFGISMAGYNVFVSLVLAAAMVVGLRCNAEGRGLMTDKSTDTSTVEIAKVGKKGKKKLS